MADGEYEMVMPFVACASQGGPYDDDSFVAGWRLAELDARLAAGPRQPTAATVRPCDAQQVDLIAMQHGYHVTDWINPDPGEWVTAGLTPAREVVAP